MLCKILKNILNKYLPKTTILIYYEWDSISNRNFNGYHRYNDTIRLNTAQIEYRRHDENFIERYTPKDSSYDCTAITIFLHEVCHGLQARKHGAEWLLIHSWISEDKFAEYSADRFARKYVRRYYND